MQYMPTRTERPADNVLVCPMPGLVVEVLVKTGERVFRGQNLVVLESMKMESDVASPVDGVIAEVRAVVGQAVEVGEVLIRFQSIEDLPGQSGEDIMKRLEYPLTAE